MCPSVMTPDAVKTKAEKTKSKLSNQKAIRVDFDGMLARMLHGIHAVSMAELAKSFGLSAQAMSNARQRKTIPLTYLLKYQDVYQARNGVPVSLDWLISGIDQTVASIPCLSDITAPPMQFDLSWISSSVAAPVKDIRYLISSEGSYHQSDLLLIDTRDIKIRDGVYVFSINARPMVKTIKIRIDGTILIDSEEVSCETADNLDCRGRVIWRGTSRVSAV